MRAILSVAASGWMQTPADSARAVAGMYTVSLLAIVPLLVAAIAAILLRRSPAGTRSLIWRSAVLALLITYVVRQLPIPGMAWVLPNALAAPLIMLGRVQVSSGSAALPGDEQATASLASLEGDPAPLVQLLFIIYLAGVVVVLAPTVVASITTSVRVARARRVSDSNWLQQLAVSQRTLGVRRRVRLRMSSDAVVPRTLGFIRPVVLLPVAASQWTETQRGAVLLHELSHVRCGDWPIALLARVVCALYWFHPGAWWIARGLKRECEYACDDSVLAAGVRPSDYAELLALAADTLRTPLPEHASTLALARGAGLRERLREVLDTKRDVRGPGASRQILAAALVLVVALPIGAVRLAPTRETLAELMLDSRWESRAFAVIGLAQRTDSVAAARQAATSDPSPRVRAWAQYALARQNTSSGH